MTSDFIAFDTETGGLNSATCALLSIAAVPSWEAPPFSCFILPVGRIDAKAAEVNGYTEDGWRRRGAVTPKQAMFEFQRWLFETVGDRRVAMAAHSAGFDLLFIEAVQARTGINLDLPKIWYCTKIMLDEAKSAHKIPRGWPKTNRLNDLGDVSGFWQQEPRAQAHDALQDARCCKHGLLWLRSLNEKKEAAGA